MRRPSTRWVRAAISNPSAVSPQSHAIVVPRDNPAKASWNTSQPAATTPTANAAMTHGSVSRQATRETMLATALAPSSHAVASTPDVAAAHSGGVPLLNTGLALGGANLLPIKVDATLEYQPFSDLAAWPNPFSLANNLVAGTLPTYLLRGISTNTLLNQLSTQLGTLTGGLLGGNPLAVNIYLTVPTRTLPFMEPMYLTGDVLNMVSFGTLGDPVYRLANAFAPAMTSLVNLGYTDVTSPITGRIGKPLVTEGALVGQGEATLMARIQQLDPIYVDIPQSSLEVLQLRKALSSGALKSEGNAARIQLVLEDGSTYAHEGKLQFAGVTVNTTTGAVTLRALVPNPERLLMPGMYVRARLDKGTDPEALLVPQPGIGRDNTGKATALVVNAENKVEQRKVEVSEAIGTNWRVTDGLKAGERVIIEGSGKVRPGQSVRVVDVQPVAVNAVSAVPAAAPTTVAAK